MLPAMYVLVGVMPPVCTSRYTCAGWCGATRFCRVLCMCRLMSSYPLVLPAMHVLVGVVPAPCFARYVYIVWRGATQLCQLCMSLLVWCYPLYCALCMCWLVWCHRLVMHARHCQFASFPSLVLPAMYVLVAVVPHSCAARYICACWCGATNLCYLLCLLWLVRCHFIVFPAM